ncbi:MAG: DUF4398 domain-containing protein [Lysobacter sp.]
MHRSFSQIRPLLLGTVLACALGACATLPPPTSELASAQQSLMRATNADADQYAGDQVELARAGLGRAQAAMAEGRNDVARALALAAQSDADLAHALSAEAKAATELAQRKSEVRHLQERLHTGGGR